jgi:hypothetical protein
MATKQNRYRQRKQADGYKQITLMLPGAAVEELDRRADAEKSSRVEIVRGWLQSGDLPRPQ